MGNSIEAKWSEKPAVTSRSALLLHMLLEKISHVQSEAQHEKCSQAVGFRFDPCWKFLFSFL